MQNEPASSQEWITIAPANHPMKHGPTLVLAFVLLGSSSPARCQNQNSLPGNAGKTTVTLAEFVTSLQQRAKALESASGMRLGFQSLAAAHHLPPASIRYSDYVLARLLYQATRDAGLWNLHGRITDQPPNSDNVWRTWKTITRPSVLLPTATAECDELSALYAFLAHRAGLRGVGLFWPTLNHTVAVWTLHPASGSSIRVVVPTSQIFLEQTDDFDTRKFDPWSQKIIYEYTRPDVPDTFEIPKPLVDFFLLQLDKYAGASDGTLQRLRYVRDAVFRNFWTPQQATDDALVRKSKLLPISPEDLAALQYFANDMQLKPVPSRR